MIAFVCELFSYILYNMFCAGSGVHDRASVLKEKLQIQKYN